MEGGNAIPGGMLPPEMALHQQQQLQHDHLFPFPTKSLATDHHRPQQQLIRYASGSRSRLNQLSPEDEPRFGENVADGSKPSPSPSPWHRMKWTDSMIRLLIMVVYYMGDDGGGTDGDQHPQPAAAAGKGKKSPAPAGALQQQQQKKGKWKSVSTAMMEKGFYVSPQQCEDKFNDLNKRYKRVNELLGKGAACRVVENQSLLDSMDHLTAKAKDEARKLLNSKHLFFREMCNYHNSAGSAAAATSSCAPLPPPPPTQQQVCFHHPNVSRGEATSLVRGGIAEEEAEDDQFEEIDEVDSKDDDDYDAEDEYYDDDGEDEDDDDHHSDRRRHRHQKHEEGDLDEDNKGFMATTTTNSTNSGAKRGRGTEPAQPRSSAGSPPLSLSLWSPAPSTSMQQLRSELTGISGRGEQRHWLRTRAAELDEQRLGYQSQALQLERRRFKWLRFSGNKEREMERMKLENDRLRLENERMLLLLRQLEFELVNNEGGGAAASSPAVPDHLQTHTTNPYRHADHVKKPGANHATAGAAGPLDV